MRRKPTMIIPFAIFTFLLAFSGWGTDTVPVKAEEGLGQDALARYDDPFDKLRDDVWEKLGFIPGQDIRETNFKLADVRIENGQLRLETRTGSFSLGGLGSKFMIRGDFDIQIDCAVEFRRDLGDMDQLIQFHVADRTKELQDLELEVVNICIFKPGKGEPRLFTGHIDKGKFDFGARTNVDGFKGSLRITRAGNRITTLYRKEADPDWQKMRTVSSFAGDAGVGFKIQNFNLQRTSIGASVPFVAFFDNFRINAAQEIVESEI